MPHRSCITCALNVVDPGNLWHQMAGQYEGFSNTCRFDRVSTAPQGNLPWFICQLSAT